jgi:hypothetical protein
MENQDIKIENQEIKPISSKKLVMKVCSHCRRNLNIRQFGKFMCGDIKKTCLDCSNKYKEIGYSKYNKIDRKKQDEKIGARGPLKGTKEKVIKEVPEGCMRCVKCKCDREIEEYKVKLNGSICKCCNTCLGH